MKTDSEPQKSFAAFLSFVFSLLFVFHIMMLPVWLGVHGIMIFETDDSFFSVFPGWFVGSAILCMILATILGLFPRHKTEPDADPKNK